MRTRPPAPSGQRLPTLITVAAIALALVLAALLTRTPPTPAPPTPAPLADTAGEAASAGGWSGEAGTGDAPGDGALDAAAWDGGDADSSWREPLGDVESAPPKTGSEDAVAGDGANRSRGLVGEREARERRARRDRRVRRGARRNVRRDRRAGGRRSARNNAPSTWSDARGRRGGGSERRGSADRAGGAGNPIPTTPPAGPAPRRQDPPAATRAPGAGTPPRPEFALG